MRVNPNSGQVDLNGVVSPSPARAVRLDQDQLVLSGTEKVKRALEQVPTIRAEKVAKAKALLEDPAYPPDTVLAQIATLLGEHITAAK